jgi:hypothetical protein
MHLNRKLVHDVKAPVKSRQSFNGSNILTYKRQNKKA